MNKSIASKDNQYVKLAKSLSLKKYREEKGLFLAEGVRTVEEVVASPLVTEFVLYSPRLLEQERGVRLLSQIQAAGLKNWLLEEPVFKSLSGTENPQGVVAVVKMPSFSLDELTGSASMLLVIDGVQDPGNLGAMIRTAWAAGAGGIIALQGAVDFFNPKTVRASMGAIFHQLLVKGTHREIIDFLKGKGYRIMVADLSGKSPFYNCDAAGSVAWVLGSEANGPDPLWLENADSIVKIPLIGGAESLNVAVAAGILMYESVRQRAGQVFTLAN